MYHLILIDDEFSTVNMLKNYINWPQYHLQVSACFTDTAKALDYISKNPVNAVITDICMPDMDGIEFAKYCKETYPDIIIGFISAHRNFEYAYLAANLNVVGYVLKPLIKSDIISMCQNMFACLVKKEDSKENLLSEETLHYKNLHNQLVSQIILLDMSYSILTNPYKINQMFRQQNIAVSCDMPFHIWDFTIKNYSVYIDNVTQNHHVTALYNAINTIVVRNYDELVVLPFLGIRDHLLFVAIDTTYSNLQLSLPELNAILAKIKHRLNYYLKIDVDIHILDEFTKLEQLISFVPNVHSSENLSEDNFIGLAISYIQTNLASIHSIEDVANHVHLSAAYFGRLFKRKTGKSFNHYLNEQRIDQAKKLLQNSNETIFSIASLCGFRNESYFYTIFSELVGCTPSQYRDVLSN